MHPYVYRASLPLLQYMREHNILPTSYSGLTPLARAQDGPLTSVLDRMASQLSAERGWQVTPPQILQLWLRKKGIPYTTSVQSHC